MDKYQSATVFFVPRPTSIRCSNQVIPMHESRALPNEWIPNKQKQSSYTSPSNNYFKNSDAKSTNNTNERPCLKACVISLGVLSTLTALAAIVISTYEIILLNERTATTTTSTTTSLPSQCYSNLTINDTTRLATAASGTLCDAPMFNASTTWVRFDGAGGTQIATSSPGINHCGTAATGWYVGAMPAFSATINGTVCYAWTTSMCDYVNIIFVSNCGTFYVYGLIQPPYCTLRYCTI